MDLAHAALIREKGDAREIESLLQRFRRDYSASIGSARPQDRKW